MPVAMIHRMLAILILACVARCCVAAENPLRIELVSAVTAIQPGKPFYLALHLQHPKGYHTYWKFTGIVGIPTAIQWSLPRGWKAGEIEWPEPERVFMFQIKAQGFSGGKLLPVQITPPANLRPGTTARIGGKAVWMCCGRDCNPGFKDLSIELPVTAEPAPPDARWNGMIAQSRASVAKRSADWATEAVRRGNEIVLRIKPASDRARLHLPKIKDVIFFTEDGLVDPNKPESLEKTGAEIVLVQTISEHAPKPLPSRVIGILQSPQGWLDEGKPKSIRISEPLAR